MFFVLYKHFPTKTQWPIPEVPYIFFLLSLIIFYSISFPLPITMLEIFQQYMQRLSNPFKFSRSILWIDTLKAIKYEKFWAMTLQ